MIITIHQPSHLPWISFFNKMIQADTFVLLDHVQFNKQYFENRNQIKSDKGPKWITVPVKTSGKSKQSILEVEVDDQNKKWKRRYLANIELAYKEAPYWKDVRRLIWPVLEREHKMLVDINLELIEVITDYLDIKTQKVRSSSLPLRGEMKSDLNLAICKILGAEVYISGPSGRDYLNRSSFEKEGIKVVYHDFQFPTYPQLFGTFEPGMSVIDLIANCGPESKIVIQDCGVCSLN